MNLIKKKTQPPGYYNWEETSAKLAKKTPEHQLHPIRPHHNLGRPQPTRLETTAISLGRRAQTNHRYHRPASCHYFLGGQRGNFFLCHQDLNPGWCLPQLGSLPLHYKSVGITSNLCWRSANKNCLPNILYGDNWINLLQCRLHAECREAKLIRMKIGLVTNLNICL